MKKQLPKDIIISLFDYSGSWSLPYKKAGYLVIQVDIKLGIDILTWDYKFIDRNRVAGILAAPPCTDYTVSGNRFWKQKDTNGSTALSNSLVSKTLEIVAYFNPEFFAMENPKGRLKRMLAGNYEPGEPKIIVPASLQKLLMEPALKFNPCDYGDNWTKETYLWGWFNALEKYKTLPHRWTEQGSWSQQLGGKSEKTKEIRSLTPGGFARAMFNANNPMKFELKEEHLYMFNSCKIGMWTCDFSVSKEMCDMCEDGDNYEENEFAMEFETEEEFMQAVFDKGEGIRRSINPERLYSYE